MTESAPRKELAPDQVIAIIAHVLEKAGVATTAIGSELGFRVHGDRGGDWIVDLRTPGGSWSNPKDPEKVERCKTALYAEREAFSHLITNPDLIEQDLASGFIAVEGERAAWSRLGKLLGSSGGLVRQRARQSRVTTTTAKGRAEPEHTVGGVRTRSGHQDRRFKPWR